MTRDEAIEEFTIEAGGVCVYNDCRGCSECQSARIVLRVGQLDRNENGIWMRLGDDGPLRHVAFDPPLRIGRDVEVLRGIIYADTTWRLVAEGVWHQVAKYPAAPDGIWSPNGKSPAAGEGNGASNL